MVFSDICNSSMLENCSYPFNMSSGNDSKDFVPSTDVGKPTVDFDTLVYPQDFKIFSVLCFSLLFLVGFIGNILVIYVVLRSPKMRSLTNFYLVSLAVADCLVLLSATLPAIPEFFFYKHQWLYGAAMCSIFVFLQYLGINASALSIAAFTIERYIGICHPMIAQVYFTSKRAKMVICGLWTFSVAYNACWIYLATTNTMILANGAEIKTCTFRISRDQYSAVYMVDLLLFYVVPLILTCVLYTRIALRLRQSTRDMKKPINPLASHKPTLQLLILDKSINKDFRQSMMGDRKDTLKKMEKARFQIVKMLIVIAVLFAVLWLPYRALVVYNSFAAKSKRFMNEWYIITAKLLIFINNAMNPVLYSAMSKKFRDSFVQHTFLSRCMSYKTPETKPLADRRRAPVLHRTVVKFHGSSNGIKETVNTSIDSGENCPVTTIQSLDEKSDTEPTSV